MTDFLVYTWALHYLARVFDGQLELAAGLGVGTILFAVAAAVVSTAVSMGVNALLAPNLKGPRQKDSGLQSDDYGTPIALLYGPKNRVAGTVIYYSGLQESKRRESGSGGSQTTFTYSCTAAILLGQGVSGASLVRAWANKKLIWSNNAAVGYLANAQLKTVESITFYEGTATQNPDPTLEEYLGADNVPGYRNVMYAVVKNLQLADFGPRLPYLEFEIAAHASISPATVVADIGERAGVTINVDDLDGNVGTLDGYAITQAVPATDALMPLAAAYYFSIAERGGELYAVPAGMDAVADIPIEDQSAVVAASGSVGAPSEHERKSESEMPRTVAITYRDIFRDLQASTQRAERDLGTSTEIAAIDIPLSLDYNQAKRIAARVLWGAIAARRSARVRVSNKWLDIKPGMIVNLETPVGEFIPYSLARATHGADDVIEWELNHEDPEAVNSLCDITGDDEGTEVVETGPTGKTIFQPIDTAILRDLHDNPGFYWAVAGRRPAWPGAVVFRSTDGGTDYDPMGSVVGATPMGTVTSGIPSGPTDIWDYATVLTVEMDTDTELETKSELAVLNGANSFWVGPKNGHGGEIMQFTTATLVDESTYELRGLLRGRRGTEWAVGRHGAGEKFVMLSGSNNLIRQDFGAADLDLARLYKPVTAGDGLDETDEESFTNTGEGLRPFAPVHLVGRRNSESGDITITCTMRTRLMTSGFGGGPVPVGERESSLWINVYPTADVWARETDYLVGDIVREQGKLDYVWRWWQAKRDHNSSLQNRPDGNSSNWARNWIEYQPIRRIALLNRQRYVYRWAQQSTDGLIAFGSYQYPSITLAAYQLSDSRGYGHTALATVQLT